MVIVEEELSELIPHFNIITAYLGCPTVLYSTVCYAVTTVNTISASNKLNISDHLQQSLSTLTYAVTSQPAPSCATSRYIKIPNYTIYDTQHLNGTAHVELQLLLKLASNITYMNTTT